MAFLTVRRGERAAGDRRDRPLPGDPAQPLGHRGQRPPGGGVEGVHHGGGEPADQPHPSRQRSHRVVRPRPDPAPVPLREELGLVGGHVDPDRAVALAALARQAQVQRLLDLRRPPSARDHLAGRHLEQQPGPPAGRVHLLAGGAVARTHHSAVLGDALPDAEAPPGRPGERAAVVGERQLGLVAQRRHPDEHPQVVVELRRPDDATGVHPVVGVPRRLELLEGRDDRRRVHPRQQLGTRCAVAVLPRQRPPVPDDEIGRLLHERAEVGDAGSGEQVEVDPHVDAAVAEVPVVGPCPGVPREQRVELPQVSAQPLGRHRGVLPARPRLTPVGRARHDPGAVLPDPPQRLHLRGVAHDDARRTVRRHRGDDGVRGRLGLGAGGSPGLDVEPPTALGQHPRRRLARTRGSQRRDQPGVHPLDRERGEFPDSHRVVGGEVRIRETEDGQRAGRRRLDQPDRGTEQRGAGALRAHQRAGQVESVLRQELVEVVPGHPAREVRERRAHIAGDPVGQAVQRIRHPAPRRRPGPEHHPLAAIGEHVEGDDVVDGLAPRHRVRAAGVVADHSAERAAVVRGRVRPERQAVRAGGGPQGVEHDTGLHTRGPRVRVDVEHAVEVRGEVEGDRMVDRLARDRRARADREHRDVVRAAHGHGRLDVVGIHRRDHSDRHPPVVRGVRRVHRAGRGAEADAAPHRSGEGMAQVVAEIAGWIVAVRRRHQLETDLVRMSAMSSSVGVRAQVASRRCCFIVPGTRSGTSDSP